MHKFTTLSLHALETWWLNGWWWLQDCGFQPHQCGERTALIDLQVIANFSSHCIFQLNFWSTMRCITRQTNRQHLWYNFYSTWTLKENFSEGHWFLFSIMNRAYCKTSSFCRQNFMKLSWCEIVNFTLIVKFFHICIKWPQKWQRFPIRKMNFPRNKLVLPCFKSLQNAVQCVKFTL